MTPPRFAGTRRRARLQGFHATVEADPAANRVVKRLRRDVKGGVGAAALGESERLGRLHAALAGHPHLRCPAPIAVDADEGTITMTWCPGRALADLLTARPAPALDEVYVVDQLVAGLEAYVAALGEPHPDFTLANVLYDPNTAVVSLVDFTPTEIDAGDRDAPFEVSLGFLVAVGTYESLRPATWWDAGHGRRVAHLSGLVLRRLGGRHALRPDVVRRVADARFAILRGFGSPLRRAWYATVGAATYARRRDRLIACLGSPQPSEALGGPADGDVASSHLAPERADATLVGALTRP